MKPMTMRASAGPSNFLGPGAVQADGDHAIQRQEDAEESGAEHAALVVAGAAWGVATSLATGAMKTATVVSDSLWQLADAATGGAFHDHPLVAQAWQRQGQLGRAMVDTVIHPVDTAGQMRGGLVQRYKEAMALPDTFRKSAAAAELLYDVVGPMPGRSLTLIARGGRSLSRVGHVGPLHAGAVATKTLPAPSGLAAAVDASTLRQKPFGKVGNVRPAFLTAEDFAQLPATGTLNPRTVRFSQDSASASFKKPFGSVDDFIERLGTGEINSANVEPVRIVQHDGKVFTLDNRRLHSFREANLEIPYQKLEAIPKRELFKFTTQNDGTSIVIRKGK